MNNSVTFVIINFNTPKHLRNCLTTLLDCYIDYSILIIDNHSDDTSYLKHMLITSNNICCLFNPINVTHGPAMHQAACLTNTDYVFFLDSDCIVRKSGFIEEMIQLNAYAVGNIQKVNKDGINIPSNQRGAIDYVHPSAMLINRKQYFSLPQFKKHGAPCIDNMIQANVRGLPLVDYPIEDYVIHIGRGTREGINVSWDGISKKRKWF